MAEQKPANTIDLGTQAYMIESPLNPMADCLVMAHGGSIDKTQKFTVPVGITVQFFVAAGSSNNAPNGPMGFIQDQIETKSAGRPIGVGVGRRTYEPGSACPDYILAKALGTHWKVVANRASYLEVRNMLHDPDNPGNGLNWIPHVVTVRNRTSIFRKQNVWLSSLINAIITAKPQITTIYCGNCRDDDESQKKKFLKTVGRPSYDSAPGR